MAALEVVTLTRQCVRAFPWQPGNSRPARLLGLIALSAMVGSLYGCGTTSEQVIPHDVEITAERTSFSFADREGFDLMRRYAIAPGDILDVLFQIRTWLRKDEFRIAVDHTVAVNFVDTPELNQEQMVRPDGNITLPYLGDVYVVGKTPKEVEQALLRAYQGTLKEPEIFVQITEFQSAIKELKRDLHTAPRGLSRLVTVRPDGFVTFPMVGEVMVAGRSISEVNAELNERYDQIISGLHVDLFLERHAGSQIYVVGAVNEPGSFSIARPVTVEQAMAMAGSWRDEARLDSIIVARHNAGTMVVTKLNLKRSAGLGGRGAFFYLMPDDIVYVPRTRISEVAQIGRELRDAILFRGWNISFDSVSLDVFD